MMGIHNIPTPGGFTQSGPNGDETFEFSPDYGSDMSARFNNAQRVIDSEVLRYNSPYVPLDTGTLEHSGITNTVIGSGEVVYSTPYARRWYYNQANFQGAPMRGAYHFERMKADHKEDIRRSAGKELNK